MIAVSGSGVCDLDDVGVGVAAARMHRLEELDRVGDVGRGERLAVMELHVRPELEAVAQAVRADRPFGRQRRTRLDVVVVLQQPFGGLGADSSATACRPCERDQRGRLGVLQEGERAALLRRLRAGAPPARASADRPASVARRVVRNFAVMSGSPSTVREVSLTSGRPHSQQNVGHTIKILWRARQLDVHSSRRGKCWKSFPRTTQSPPEYKKS